MEEKVILKSAGVHDGAFHADEVTACALLVLYGLVEPNLVRRTRDPEILRRCEYVCDVGGHFDPQKHLFDHHQVEYKGKMSSAGMVLKFLLDTGVIEKGFYDYLNRTLILGVDADDNGLLKMPVGVATFSDVLANFLPIEYETSFEEYNLAFREALDFVVEYLLRIKKRYIYRMSSQEKVKKSMKEGKEYLIFDESLPWLESFFELGGEKHPALFLIMPTGKHWKLRAIPPNYEDRMNVRRPLPKEWGGLHEEDLKKVSGIPGAIFCHKGLFFSTWETKEDALKALDFVLKRDRI